MLSGTDGATYTYRNVTVGVAQRTRVNAGTQIGVSGPRGLTFSISAPDVRGAVDADEALQAWAAGLSVNVRALPSTITQASAALARRQVLVVTDAGAGQAATDLAKSVAGQMVTVQTDTVGDTRSLGGQAPAAQQIAAPGGQRLVVAILANGTPAQAAALAARLPSGQACCGSRRPAPRRSRLRPTGRSSPPAPDSGSNHCPPLAAVNAPAVNGLTERARAAGAGSWWSPTGALATATLVAAYASTAYRLESVSAQARTVVSWAEERLGYPTSGRQPGRAASTAPANNGRPRPGRDHRDPQRERPVATDQGPPRRQNQLAPGDLVFYAALTAHLPPRATFGIYIGNSEIIDAPYSGANVRIDPLTSISGYAGATDPYATTSTVGTTVPVPAGNPDIPLAAPAAPLAAPAALNQYQSFAQTLADTTWGPSQFPYLNLLWERESGWNPAATNPSSGAFGIPQALPTVKMASAGLDWATNAYTQIIWGIGYIHATYGTPQAAWAHELAYGWY